MEETNKGGRPRLFESPKELANLFNDYIEHCTTADQFPNIAGFAVYVRSRGDKFETFTRETFYNYSKYDGFFNTVKGIEEALENAVLNSKSQPPLIKLAYLNNKHGYTQKTENVNVNVEAEMTDQEADKILKSAGFNTEEKDNAVLN